MSTEAEVKRACEHLLELLQNQKKLLFQRNNSFAGQILRRNQSVGFIKNNKRGAPDFYLFLPQGLTIHLELKSSKGKMSPDQKAWEQTCKNLGHHYYVVDDVANLEKIIAFHLAS